MHNVRYSENYTSVSFWYVEVCHENLYVGVSSTETELSCYGCTVYNDAYSYAKELANKYGYDLLAPATVESF